MFSSLIQSRPTNRRVAGRDLSASPSSTPAGRHAPRRRATADFTEADDDDEDTHEDEMDGFEAADDDEDEDDQNEDGRQRGQPLGRRTPLPVLPLFSASHLGMFS